MSHVTYFYKGNYYTIEQIRELQARENETQAPVAEVVVETPTETSEAPVELALEDMKLSQLKEVARERGIEFANNITHPKLLAKLQEAPTPTETSEAPVE